MPRGKVLPDVPRWAVLAAYAVPLVTLPSGLWRIALVAGLPVASDPVRTGWGVLYVLTLTAVSEALALLTLGLVQPWGEVVPRWIPLQRPARQFNQQRPDTTGGGTAFARTEPRHREGAGGPRARSRYPPPHCSCAR
ncbi:hypothetical protein [Streptomyces agglomeratus]|uniref:hypothetical protein n=1 Tax=Streptomyces agglomeratus TaxID=285458 RepID=UPI000A48397A|nr:hypothetical protein [Streptomyces agglomeratus]